MVKAQGLRPLFEATIGLEIHTELLTASKMFSASPNAYGLPPNTAITELDLGYPGAMPSVNRRAVELGIILGNALGMTLDTDNIRFDRKHYFYPDLPKGYQITQFYHPIGVKGKLTSDVNGTPFTTEITRIHLEEDSAKNVAVEGGRQGVDFNRAGVPLLEIVTDPCMHTAEQATSFVSALKRLLQFKMISRARMEEGSMRCDVNVSVAIPGSGKLGTRVEIKNLNSIANIGKAINFEIDRQIAAALRNDLIGQETRRWDEASGQTVFMRVKTGVIDYRYITEPNLAPIALPPERVAAIIGSSFKAPDMVEKELADNGLTVPEVANLMNDFGLYAAFEFVRVRISDYREAYRWVCVETSGALAKNKKTMDALNVMHLQEISHLVNAIKRAEINSKQGKEILVLLIERNMTFQDAMGTADFKQINDETVIKGLVERLVDANQPFIKENEGRAERVEKFLVGLVMKETNGQANPQLTANLVRRALAPKAG